MLGSCHGYVVPPQDHDSDHEADRKLQEALAKFKPGDRVRTSAKRNQDKLDNKLGQVFKILKNTVQVELLEGPVKTKKVAFKPENLTLLDAAVVASVTVLGH